MSLHLKQAAAGLAIILALPLAHAQYRKLNVPTLTQEHSEWCWSGSSKALIGFFKSAPSQCAIVNWAYGINYACGNSSFNWNSAANQPNNLYGPGGSVQNILANWGVGSNLSMSASPWTTVVSDINASKPFIIRFAWTAGGGHMLVGSGYQVSNGKNYMLYMNPWPGEGNSESLYSWVVSASDHKWTHTLRAK